MRKSLLFRLFGLGAVPRKLMPALENEGILVLDEGMPGWFVAKSVDGPGKRYRHRREGFSGWLGVTNERILCYTYGRRQISIAVDDPRISRLHVDLPADDRLSLSFESSDFRDDWKGVLEFRFRTEKALQFRDALVSFGVQPGSAAADPPSRR